MEQMYLLEIFIDKVTILATEENEKSGANKKLIIKVKFGPRVQFIIKEGQLASNKGQKDDVIERDEQGRRKWVRPIRVGKSYLFPSYPDTLLMILSKFPLEIEVWNDDDQEEKIFVGIGSMQWDTEFFFMLKETRDAKRLHEPLTIKTVTTMWAECCCAPAGDISFILRLSSLGESIITEFQQLMNDPDSFVFRTNKAPSMFKCKRIEGNDPNFCMVGSLYETTTLEDPTVVESAKQKIEVCTEFESCGAVGTEPGTCEPKGDPKKKKYPMEKIRMGDITGPCGNSNCPLAHKVRNYIRALDTYKAEAKKLEEDKGTGAKGKTTRKVCGACCCKDDRYHRDDCPEFKARGKPVICTGCGGVVHAGETCEDRKQKLFGTGATPKGSKTRVAYVFNVNQVPDFKESMFGHKFIVGNVIENHNDLPSELAEAGLNRYGGCCCRNAPATFAQSTFRDTGSGPDFRTPTVPPAGTMGINNPSVYNADTKTSAAVYYCTDIPEDKDCKCAPPKPTPPCNTFDCDCISEMGNVAARKAHKPYCPSYKHKSNCPVTMMNEEEETKEDYEDDSEPLPYGLPPIQLGPCPVSGRPCTVPDGFARMYKVAVQPTLPPSYSDAGKVCCSKEYERIRKAIKDYMKHEKADDYRCLNKFNVDTEKRCCDKEQRLLSLMGRECCGSHKMALHEKYKQDKK